MPSFDLEEGEILEASNNNNNNNTNQSMNKSQPQSETSNSDQSITSTTPLNHNHKVVKEQIKKLRKKCLSYEIDLKKLRKILKSIDTSDSNGNDSSLIKKRKDI